MRNEVKHAFVYQDLHQKKGVSAASIIRGEVTKCKSPALDPESKEELFAEPKCESGKKAESNSLNGRGEMTDVTERKETWS